MRRTRLLFPNTFTFKILNINPKQSKKDYISFALGSLLIVSESLPLIENIEFNGIIQTALKLHSEYKKNT